MTCAIVAAGLYVVFAVSLLVAAARADDAHQEPEDDVWSDR